MKRLAIILWLALAHGCVPHVCVAVDAESQLGVVAGNDSQAVAHENTRRVESCRTSIEFAAKQFFFEIPVHYYPNGGRITGAGGAGLREPEDVALTDNNPNFIFGTRFDCVNPESGADFIVGSGTGQRVRDVQIYGERWRTPHDKLTGKHAASCIAMEGRDQPPSGRHLIQDVLCANADCAIRTLPTPVETHADLCDFERVYASNCRVFFQCGNLQSVSHSFRHCFIEEIDSPIVGFEMLRGGRIAFQSFYMNGNHCTLLKARDDMGPNGNYLSGSDFQWDHPGPIEVSDAYLRLVDTPFDNYGANLSGYINNLRFPFDRSRLGIDKRGVKAEIVNLNR
jgi:hypothetical protein